MCFRALRAPCPTCSHAPRASCSTCFSCPTCSHAPRGLRALLPYVLSCLVRYVHSCPTYIVPYVLSCLTCSRAIDAPAPRALHVLVSHLFYVFWYLMCLTCSCTSHVFCLAFSWDAHDSDSTGLVLLNFQLFHRTILSSLFYKKSLTLKVT